MMKQVACIWIVLSIYMAVSKDPNMLVFLFAVLAMLAMSCDQLYLWHHKRTKQ